MSDSDNASSQELQEAKENHDDKSSDSDLPNEEARALLIKRGVSAEATDILLSLITEKMLCVDDIDDRSVGAIKDLSSDSLKDVVVEIKNKWSKDVVNRSAFFCGTVQQWKRKRSSSESGPGTSHQKRSGPDETKLKELLAKISNYKHEVTVGQRRLGLVAESSSDTNADGREIFVGKLPKDMYEDQLFPMFEEIGKIHELRVMIDPTTGQGRGFCFVSYVNEDDADKAVSHFHEYEIKPNRKLQVNMSTPNRRLFIGNIPKTKDNDQLKEDFARILEGVVDVITYGVADDPRKKNRGFCFVEFDKHSSASAARRKLMKYPRIWSSDIYVDWADPLDEPDQSTMSKVKVLYVKNLTHDVTEDQLQEVFSAYGPLERVKKVKDYGFIHFEERDDALRAMEKLNGTPIGRNGVSITLAKPVSEKSKQRKEERRLRQATNAAQAAVFAGGMPPHGFGGPFGHFGPHPMGWNSGPFAGDSWSGDFYQGPFAGPNVHPGMPGGQGPSGGPFRGGGMGRSGRGGGGYPGNFLGVGFQPNPGPRFRGGMDNVGRGGRGFGGNYGNYGNPRGRGGRGNF